MEMGCAPDIRRSMGARFPLRTTHVIVLFILICGCGEDTPSTCPDQLYSVVEGRVTACGQPVQVSLTLRDLQERLEPQREFRCQTDSTGWYAIEAPIGCYTLEVRSPGSVAYFGRDGAIPGWERPDSLLLTEERARVDFHLGSLSVEVAAPAAFEGRDLYLSLRLLSDPSRWISGRNGTVSDGRATFNLPSVFPFDYCLSLRPENCETIWIPGTRNPDNATVITVGTNEPVTHTAALPQPWYIEGSITGSWQILNLPPPRLVAFADDSAVLADRRVADDGAYSLEILLPEAVRLHVENGRMQRWVGGVDFASATRYVGDSGEIIEGTSYVESAIECRLESDEMPMRVRADVALYDANGTCVTPEGFDPARNNPIPIPDLEPGTYFLQASPQWTDDPWLPQWFDHADSLESATPIRVFATGTVTRITVHLETHSPVLELKSSNRHSAESLGLVGSLGDQPTGRLTEGYPCNR